MFFKIFIKIKKCARTDQCIAIKQDWIAEETSLECKISIPQIARRMVDNVKRKATDLEL